jgi:multisubunit Na+/H+ antiporter MnhG subunit
MGFDAYDFILSAIVFSIYAPICIISIIFTFLPDIYTRIHETLNFSVFSTPIILSPIERSIDWFDIWAMKNNKVVGPFLIVLSIYDIKSFFDLIFYM